ncbi:MAG: hypothetical protein ACRCX2_13060 [Paraclostridium sp.]
MSMYKDILLLLGMDIPKTASFNELTFDDVDDAVRQELLLIQRVQKYNDFLAEQQLMAMYRGLLTKLVNKCPAISTVGYETVYTRASNALKHAIKIYKLDSYKVAKPATYFTANIEGELKKLISSASQSSTIRLPENLALYKKDIAMAQKTLRAMLGREPLEEEIFDYIKKEMKKGGQGFKISDLKRVMGYDSSEYSGSKIIGSENADGAESLTFGEVFGGNNISTEDEYNTQLEGEKLLQAINEFTDDESKRNFLMRLLGVGEFLNNPSKSFNEACFLSGVTYHIAKNIFKQFQEFAKNKGLL